MKKTNFCINCGIEISSRTQSKKCRSCIRKGAIPWNKNKHHPKYQNFIKKVKQPKSENHKKKIGLAHKGRYVSEETKKKIREARAKQIISKKQGIKHSETMKKLYLEGKIINAMLGKHLSKEHKMKISLGNKGKIVSEETRIKLSNAHKGKPNKTLSKTLKRLYSKGKKTWCKGLTKKIDKRLKAAGEKIRLFKKGKPRSDNTKFKISQTRKQLYSQGKIKKLFGKDNPSYGFVLSKNPNWQGGKSFEPYTLDFNKRFKEAVKERDHHCCQMCNIGLEDLHLLKRTLCVHHIDYDKKNSFPQNCVSLCNKCHSITNMNRNSWKSFFQSLLAERYQYKYTEDQKIILDFNEVEQ